MYFNGMAMPNNKRNERASNVLTIRKDFTEIFTLLKFDAKILRLGRVNRFLRLFYNSMFDKVSIFSESIKITNP